MNDLGGLFSERLIIEIGMSTDVSIFYAISTWNTFLFPLRNRIWFTNTRVLFIMLYKVVNLGFEWIKCKM